jgi:hypothetical protein
MAKFKNSNLELRANEKIIIGGQDALYINNGSITLNPNTSVQTISTQAVSASEFVITGATGNSRILYSADDLYITNNDPDGEVYITATQTGGSTVNLFRGDPDGSFILYHQNDIRIQSANDGIAILDASSADDFRIRYGGGYWDLYAFKPDSTILRLLGENAASQLTTLGTFDPDGSVSLMNAGIKAFDTTNGGVIVYDSDGNTAAQLTSAACELYFEGTKVFSTTNTGISVDNTVETITLEATTVSASEIVVTGATGNARMYYTATDDLVIRNQDLGGQLIMEVSNAAAGDENVFVSIPGGRTMLYYAGSEVLRTASSGVQITDSGGSTVLFNLSSSTNAVIGNETAGSQITLQGETDTGSNVNMATFDPHGAWTFSSRNSGNTATNTMMTLSPDGAVEQYFAGIKASETTNGGIKIYDSNGTQQAEISSAGINLGNQDSTLVQLRIDQVADTIILGDPGSDRLQIGTNTATLDGGNNEIVIQSNSTYWGSAGGAGQRIYMEQSGPDSMLFAHTNHTWLTSNEDSAVSIFPATGITGLEITSTYGRLYFAGNKSLDTTNGGVIVYDSDGNTAAQLTSAACELYLEGTKRLETFYDSVSGGYGIQILGDAATELYEMTGYGGVFTHQFRQHNGDIVFKVEDSNGIARNMIYLDANSTDTRVALYAGDGVNVLRTQDTGSEGGIQLMRGGGAGTGVDLMFNSGTKDFWIQNREDGGDIYITGEVATDTENTMAQFAPDGEVGLYYAGTKVFYTLSNGIAVSDDGGTDKTLLQHITSTGYLTNSTIGGDLYLRVTASGPTSENAIICREGASVDLYYDGTIAAKTIVGGMDIEKIRLSTSPTASGSGDTILATVDQNTVGAGGLLVKSADGNWDDADKDSSTTAGYLALAMESGTGASKELLIRGYFRNNAWNFTPGQQLFVSDSGTITATVSGYTTGDIIQVVGYADAADKIYFNPSPEYDEVA